MISMGYEFRIKLLEAETAHLKEMQQLLSSHQDITDARLEKMDSIAGSLLQSMVELRSLVGQTSADVGKLAKVVDGLIAN